MRVSSACTRDTSWSQGERDVVRRPPADRDASSSLEFEDRLLTGAVAVEQEGQAATPAHGRDPDRGPRCRRVPATKVPVRPPAAARCPPMHRGRGGPSGGTLTGLLAPPLTPGGAPLIRRFPMRVPIPGTATASRGVRRDRRVRRRAARPRPPARRSRAIPRLHRPAPRVWTTPAISPSPTGCSAGSTRSGARDSAATSRARGRRPRRSTPTCCWCTRWPRCATIAARRAPTTVRGSLARFLVGPQIWALQAAARRRPAGHGPGLGRPVPGRTGRHLVHDAAVGRRAGPRLPRARRARPRPAHGRAHPRPDPRRRHQPRLALAGAPAQPDQLVLRDLRRRRDRQRRPARRWPTAWRSHLERFLAGAAGTGAKAGNLGAGLRFHYLPAARAADTLERRLAPSTPTSC